LEPRKPGFSVVEGKDITPDKVKALSDAASACWDAIIAKDLNAFAAAYKASFEAQISMFPGMVTPTITTTDAQGHEQSSIIDLSHIIQKWQTTPGVHALKFPGAGGGGYLALVVNDSIVFCAHHPEAFGLQIRRE